jgi:hypothetical protein
MKSKHYFAFNSVGKDKKKMDEDITPEEELHNFLKDLKKEKDTREKYKAITGKEAPRELTYVPPQVHAAITESS